MGFKARARANKAKTGDDEKKKDAKQGRNPVASTAARAGRTAPWWPVLVGHRREHVGQIRRGRKNRVRVCKSCYRSWKRRTSRTITTDPFTFSFTLTPRKGRCTPGVQFRGMRSRAVVRSLISGHTTVVAHDDSSINLLVPGHRERRVTIASIPSVLLTMPNRQGQDVLLVGGAHGRLHVIPMELATVAARIDLNAGRIRALAASPMERGDVMVATSNGTVAVVDLEAKPPAPSPTWMAQSHRCVLARTPSLPPCVVRT